MKDLPRILSSLDADPNFARHLTAARRRRRVRGVAFCAALVFPAALFSLVSMRWVSTPTTAVPPIEELLRGAHELPDGSPALIGISLLVISRIDPESAQGRVMAPALASVARSGIGAAAEPWARRALTNPARGVRREAVIWYPKIHPLFREDPAAVAVFEAARSSLAGQ